MHHEQAAPGAERVAGVAARVLEQLRNNGTARGHMSDTCEGDAWLMIGTNLSRAIGEVPKTVQTTQ